MLVDEHTSSEDMPYKFNGKELDQETGLYYYGARYMNPVTSLWYGVDPEKEKSLLIGSYTFCNGNPIRLVDPDGKWSWPWERASLIEYRGEGVFGIRLENFSTATRNSFARANNDPKNWKHGEIGINTEVGKISINNCAHKNYSVGRKLPGIDPKDGAINIKRPIARSTGQEDRRFHKFEPMPIRGSAKAVGAIAILNISISAIDTYLTYTTFWDSEALNKQKALLFTSINAVNLHMDLIPEEFRNDDKMGAIVNYVFQGENSTGDKEITRIGMQILQKMERYDKESKRYKPVIED